MRQIAILGLCAETVEVSASINAFIPKKHRSTCDDKEESVSEAGIYGIALFGFASELVRNHHQEEER
jgi:hypothetical protein